MHSGDKSKAKFNSAVVIKTLNSRVRQYAYWNNLLTKHNPQSTKSWNLMKKVVSKPIFFSVVFLLVIACTKELKYLSQPLQPLCDAIPDGFMEIMMPILQDKTAKLWPKQLNW